MSNHRWPLQDIPLYTSRNLWRKIIKIFFQINDRILPLERRLKEWIISIHFRQTLHEWYCSSANQEIHHRSKTKIETFFSIASGRYYLLNVDSKQKYLELPIEAIPITLVKKGLGVHLNFTMTSTSNP